MFSPNPFEENLLIILSRSSRTDRCIFRTTKLLKRCWSLHNFSYVLSGKMLTLFVGIVKTLSTVYKFPLYPQLRHEYLVITLKSSLELKKIERLRKKIIYKNI